MARTSAVDMFVVYQFIRRLATPFKKWEGYKTGVIDDKGNILVKPKDRTPAQNRSFKVFDVMILKLKKLLESIRRNANKRYGFWKHSWCRSKWTR